MREIFIGGGNMAEAIFSKLSDREVIVIQRNLDKLERLKIRYPKIKFFSKLDFITNVDDNIFLAIKPQDTKTVCQDIQQYTKNSTIVSVVAGITCQSLSKWLSNPKICRTMPNTAAMLGQSATAIYFTPAIHQQQIILDIFAKLGKIYHCTNEAQIDHMTAIAGSSIAYVFYFIEALVKSAVGQFDLSPELAKEVSLQVVRGGLAMLEHSPAMAIEQLRANVTSKNGTTERAIKVFEQYDLNKIIREAELACYNRAKELSQLFAED